jgi:hypothetical protein
MDVKDYLPLAGVLLGWSLSEFSALVKRSIERRRALGKAVAVVYFLCIEMIQLKGLQEHLKRMDQDMETYEELRRASIEKHTTSDPEFIKKIELSIDSLAEFYPVKAYELKAIVTRYELLKKRSLEIFTSAREGYIIELSDYERRILVCEYKLERLLRYVAFRQSAWTWLKIRWHFSNLRRNVPEGHIVFFEQSYSDSSPLPGNKSS